MRMCILAVAVFFASACTIRPEINVAEFCEENPNTRLCTEIDVNGFIEDYTESHQGGTRWENAEPDGEGTTDNDVTLSTGYFHLQGVWEALSGTSENTEGVEEGESTGSEPYELNFENMTCVWQVDLETGAERVIVRGEGDYDAAGFWITRQSPFEPPSIYREDSRDEPKDSENLVTIDGAIAGWFPGEGVRVMETRAPRIDRQFDLNELEINVSEGNRVRGGIQVNDLCDQRLAEAPCFGTLDATFECELEVEFIFPNEEDIQ